MHENTEKKSSREVCSICEIAAYLTPRTVARAVSSTQQCRKKTHVRSRDRSKSNRFVPGLCPTIPQDFIKIWSVVFDKSYSADKHNRHRCKHNSLTQVINKAGIPRSTKRLVISKLALNPRRWTPAVTPSPPPPTLDHVDGLPNGSLRPLFVTNSMYILSPVE